MKKIDGNILVTGAAGFIGAALCKKLIKNGLKVVGIDNLNDYYDANLKKKRIEIINQLNIKNKLSWNFYKCDISNATSLKNIARDIASLGEIRARIMSDKSINSINFSIDVVNDKAYISGVASNELEINLVKSHASSARFVKEVYNYIILNKDTR